MTRTEIQIEILRATGIEEDQIDLLKRVKEQVDAGGRSEQAIEDEQRKKTRATWQNLESDFRNRTSTIKDPFSHQEMQTVVFLRIQEDKNNPNRTV